MALLTLKDIGKIYVSNSNVTVGIRGVNLSFDRGEFVAITGKSGSGKSTLLNVISGMDTYEEGEMIVEDCPTQHYTQKEWEEYREKYISFIFQDYNIMESCTVLQNVELALFHIKDRKERKNRAIELLKRVDMIDHLNQKASKLSGGQKQRTVIARALAKDSPIILADEPTGNLDAATSKEIIKLLKEVSKDKLLIIVTHNFDEVEQYATRHIRIFDGSVEYDHKLNNDINLVEEKIDKHVSSKPSIKNGMILGKAIFTSRPKLSTFMCAFMIIAILALYGVTLLVKTMVNEAYYNYTYFTSLPGRVVITNNDRKPISNEELELIKQETNAKKCYSFDFLFDEDSYCYIYNPDKYANRGRPIALDIVIDEGFGENIYGRYPEKADEVFLYIPIGVRSSYSTEQLLKEKIILKDFSVFRIVGVKYFYDNNKQGKALLTHDGFNALSFMTYISRNASYTNISATIYDNGNIDLYSADNLCISFSDQKGEIYIEDILFKEDLEAGKISNFTLELSYTFEKYYYGYYGYIEAEVKTLTYSKELSIDDLYSEMPNNLHGDNINNGMSIFVISIDIINDIMDNYMTDIYNQASIFYKDNNEAKKQISKLKDMGYIATLSYEEVPNDALEVLGVSIIKLIAYVLYILAVLFIAIFVYLCTSKSLLAFKSDISIFRSMGIKSNEIKMGMFFRMFICLIPAFIFFAIASILVIFVPALNDQFTFLYFQDYFLIILGMILISLYVTSRQLKKLYKISVKESLKGEIE